MNPFEHPDQVFDLEEFLKMNQIHTEILFKDFFFFQVNQELNDMSDRAIKNYIINRCVKNDDIEIIQAYNNSQAAYLYLISEAKYTNNYPFTRKLKQCTGLGSLTPYDIYSLTIHNIYDMELDVDDHLIEKKKIIILHP